MLCFSDFHVRESLRKVHVKTSFLNVDFFDFRFIMYICGEPVLLRRHSYDEILEVYSIAPAHRTGSATNDPICCRVDNSRPFFKRHTVPSRHRLVFRQCGVVD